MSKQRVLNEMMGGPKPITEAAQWQDRVKALEDQFASEVMKMLPQFVPEVSGKGNRGVIKTPSRAVRFIIGFREGQGDFFFNVSGKEFHYPAESRTPYALAHVASMAIKKYLNLGEAAVRKPDEWSEEFVFQTARTFAREAYKVFMDDVFLGYVERYDRRGPWKITVVGEKKPKPYEYASRNAAADELFARRPKKLR